MVSSKQLIKNVISMMSSYIGRKLLTFVYFILIARYTDVKTTGSYYFLISFSVIVTLFMDFGMSQTLIREASKYPENLSKYLNNVLGFKSLLAAAMSLSGIVMVYTLEYPDITRQLVCLLIVMMIFESFSISFYSCLRVHHKMKYEARGYIIGQLITLLVGGVALWRHMSIHYLILALVANQLFNFIYSMVNLVRQLNIIPGVSFEKEVVKPFIVISFSLLISSLFGRLLSADTYLLSQFTNKGVVGLFSIPSTLVNIFQFIPIILVTVIFPALSSFHLKSQSKLARTFHISFQGLLSFSVPVAVGMAMLSKDIITQIFGIKYSGSSPILQILAFSLIPFSLSHPISSLLNACSKQVTNTILIGIASIIHVGLSIVLIPFYGASGIAWAAIIGYSFMFFAGMWFVSKMLDSVISDCFMSLVKVSLAALVMGISVHVLNGYIYYLFTIPVGIMIYFICLVLLRGITRNGFDRERAYGNWFYMARQAFD